jgi:nucleotide-binding universal stress UspA family protein
VGAEPEAFPAPSPAHGLHGLAEEIGADLVVVGSSRHSSLGQVLAGNVGVALLHGSPCAVAIAPRGYRERAELTTITVGFDGSEDAALALNDAVELGRATAAGLRIVAVAEPPPIVYGKGPGARAGWGNSRPPSRNSYATSWMKPCAPSRPTSPLRRHWRAAIRR